MKSLETLITKPKLFPLEVGLASGEKPILPHPDHLEFHPNSRDLIVYSDEGYREIDFIINSAQVVSARPLRGRPKRRRLLLKEAMNEALEVLKAKPEDFPLEITMSSGEKHFLSTPRLLKMRSDGKHLVLFPDNGFCEIVHPKDVISIKLRARRPRKGPNPALAVLKVKAKDFPLEVVVSSGEKHFLSTPKRLKMRPSGKNLVLFPDNGFCEIVRPEEVVSIKLHARRLEAI